MSLTPRTLKFLSAKPIDYTSQRYSLLTVRTLLLLYYLHLLTAYTVLKLMVCFARRPAVRFAPRILRGRPLVRLAFARSPSRARPQKAESRDRPAQGRLPLLLVAATLMLVGPPLESSIQKNLLVEDSSPQPTARAFDAPVNAASRGMRHASWENTASFSSRA